MEKVFTTNFNTLFESSNPSDEEGICDVVEGKLSDSNKHLFDKEFTPEEVIEAIQQMHPLKAPGPDGLPTLFF